MSDFASRLKQLRTQRGLSQTQLAEALGVSGDFLMEGHTDEAAKATFEDRVLLMQFKEAKRLNETNKHLVKEFLNAFLTKKRLKNMMGNSAA